MILSKYFCNTGRVEQWVGGIKDPEKEQGKEKQDLNLLICDCEIYSVYISPSHFQERCITIQAKCVAVKVYSTGEY